MRRGVEKSPCLRRQALSKAMLDSGARLEMTSLSEAARHGNHCGRACTFTDSSQRTTLAQYVEAETYIMQRLLCHLLLLSSIPLLPSAQQADPGRWVGTWKLDRAASHLVGVVVTIHRLPQSYRFDLGGTTIEVGDDGRDYATVPTRTTSFKQLNPHQWARVHKIRGKTVDTSVFTLSSDNQSFAIHTVSNDDKGKKHESDEVFRREGTSIGIDGTWRSTSAGVNTPAIFTISAVHGGGLRFSYPSENLAFVTPLDGSAVAYIGSHAVSSVRIAVNTISPTQIRRTDLLQEHPYEEAVDTLSNDGKQLTEVSWEVADPNNKNEAIYRRQY